MCGIMGVIGNSTNQYRSHEIATALLKETETRGRDATGYCSVSNNGIDFFKRNVSAEEFVKLKPWKNRFHGYDALIGHTRMATHGTHLNNINNHPHVNEDGSVAIVHNGIISSYQEIARKNGISLRGQCDSEVILRLIETSATPLEGIMKLFEHSQYTSFACEAIVKEGDRHFVYLWRESSSPAHFIDLREQLGQYFICSTPYIWKAAVEKSGMKNLLENVEITEFPQYSIWKVDPLTLEIEKFSVPDSVRKSSENFPSRRTSVSGFNRSAARSLNSGRSLRYTGRHDFRSDSDDEIEFLNTERVVVETIENIREKLDKLSDKIIYLPEGHDVDLDIVKEDLDTIENQVDNMNFSMPEDDDQTSWRGIY